ncbi:MAG TPA: CoA transferase [Burkholderiaceae bacterium]|nr:CoA transferase [Burkholderiaceae bacterium]
MTTRSTVLPSPPLPAVRPLSGVRVLSLALNLPGPAALMRLAAMGARCTKVEPPAGDPMDHYARHAYEVMHRGVRGLVLDLKSDQGRAALDKQLARTDVLLSSFRPSALDKLGLGWRALHKRHPALNLVAIVGSPGERAEEPGHDLTYMAENDLVPGTELPPTLYADMGGALMASEAALQALMLRARKGGQGVRIEVALSEAARWLGLPRAWGLTLPTGSVGGAHAGYRVYPCKDGRVAVAALEPHFAAALCRAAGVEPKTGRAPMMERATHQAVAAFLAGRTRAQLDALAREADLPLHTLP